MSDDEKRLRSYFLRLASEEELDRIEETYLATSHFSELITDTENGLVSDYVQGRLAEEERRAFESSYLVTDDRREQLEIAKAVGDLIPVPQVTSGYNVRMQVQPNLLRDAFRRFRDWVATPGQLMGLALATAIIVLLVLRVHPLADRPAADLKVPPRIDEKKIVRVLVIPVLKVRETDLSAMPKQKLSFRLPVDLPDSVEMPLELPQSEGETIIDAVLSSLDKTIWSERAVRLRSIHGVQCAELRIPFTVLQPYINRLLKLEIVERNHATLASFQLAFGQ